MKKTSLKFNFFLSYQKKSIATVKIAIKENSKLTYPSHQHEKLKELALIHSELSQR